MAVIGLGLMGGSVARSLAERSPTTRVRGATPDGIDAEAAARVLGVPVATHPRDVVAEADLVVYAAPLAAILAMLPEHAPLLRPDAAVTDLAGLKRPVVEAARRVGLAGRYVGAHPMAGGEGSGFGESRGELFLGARVWLCADDGVEPDAADRVERFWSELGGRPEWTDAESHDRLMEKVSQLPQLVANALAAVLQESGVLVSDLGPGGRDMTRLARSSPTMWRDLFAHTASDVAELLRALCAQTGELADRLEAGDLDRVAEAMARTRAWRGASEDRSSDG